MGTMSTCPVSKYLCLPLQDSFSHLSGVLFGQTLILQIETSTWEEANHVRTKPFYHGSSSLAGASGKGFGKRVRMERAEAMLALTCRDLQLTYFLNQRC